MFVRFYSVFVRYRNWIYVRRSICTVSVIPIYYQPVPDTYGTLNKVTTEHGPFFLPEAHEIRLPLLLGDCHHAHIYALTWLPKYLRSKKVNAIRLPYKKHVQSDIRKGGIFGKFAVLHSLTPPIS